MRLSSALWVLSNPQSCLSYGALCTNIQAKRGHMFRCKEMTNFEYIMKLDENGLADFCEIISDCPPPYYFIPNCPDNNPPGSADCHMCWIGWLQHEFNSISQDFLLKGKLLSYE